MTPTEVSRHWTLLSLLLLPKPQQCSKGRCSTEQLMGVRLVGCRQTITVTVTQLWTNSCRPLKSVCVVSLGAGDYTRCSGPVVVGSIACVLCNAHLISDFSTQHTACPPLLSLSLAERNRQRDTQKRHSPAAAQGVPGVKGSLCTPTARPGNLSRVL